MEIKKVKPKQLCSHKLARLSLDRPSVGPRTSSLKSKNHQYHHSSSKKLAIQELLKEN
jgi:hypothetical protein